MALEIILEDEKGQELDRVSDTRGLLLAIIRASVNETSQTLRFIDPYGDTIFNRLQMHQLLTELRKLRSRAEEPTHRELLLQIEELAERCRREPHLYIKICGD